METTAGSTFAMRSAKPGTPFGATGTAVCACAPAVHGASSLSPAPLAAATSNAAAAEPSRIARPRAIGVASGLGSKSFMASSVTIELADSVAD